MPFHHLGGMGQNIRFTDANRATYSLMVVGICRRTFRKWRFCVCRAFFGKKCQDTAHYSNAFRMMCVFFHFQALWLFWLKCRRASPLSSDRVKLVELRRTCRQTISGMIMLSLVKIFESLFHRTSVKRV